MIKNKRRPTGWISNEEEGYSMMIWTDVYEAEDGTVWTGVLDKRGNEISRQVSRAHPGFRFEGRAPR